MLLLSVPETVQTGSAWPLRSQARCTEALHPSETSRMEQTRYLSSLNSPATLQPEPRRPGVTAPALLFSMAASSRFPMPSRHTVHHSVACSKLSHLRYFSAVAPSAGRLRVEHHQFKHQLPQRDPRRLSGARSTLSVTTISPKLSFTSLFFA